MTEAVKTLIRGELEVNQTLEQILGLNTTSLIVQQVVRVSAWLASTQGNDTLDKICSMLWAHLSALNKASFTEMVREAVDMMSDLDFTKPNITVDMFSTLWGNFSRLNGTSSADLIKLLSDMQMLQGANKVYKAVEHFLPPNTTNLIVQKVMNVSAWPASIKTKITLDKLLSTIWKNPSRLNETTFDDMMRDALQLIELLQMMGDDQMPYEALQQILSSNNTGLIVQRITSWLAPTEGNITSDNILSLVLENLSGLNETTITDMMREAVKLLSDLHILGDHPMVYQDLEKFLVSTNTMSFLQTVVEKSKWLASNQGNITLDNIYSMLRGNLSGLNETCFTDMVRKAVDLLSDWQVSGNTSMVYQALEQFLASDNTTMIMQKVVDITALLATIDGEITSENILSVFLENLSALHETIFTDLMSDLHITGDAPEVIQALEQSLASNNGTMIMQKVVELASTQGNITLDHICSMLWDELSGLNETVFTDMMKEALKLLSDLPTIRDNPVGYQSMDQFLEPNGTKFFMQELSEMSRYFKSNTSNITSDIIFSIMSADLSQVNEVFFTNLIREAVKTISDLQMFGHASSVYENLNQILASNDSSLITQKVAEMSAFLVSTKGNITSDKIISMMWENLSELNETTFNNVLRDAVKQLSVLQLLGDSPVVYQHLEQFLTSKSSSKILLNAVRLASTDANITSDKILSLILANINGVNGTSFSEEAVSLLSSLQILEESPMLYHINQFLGSSNTSSIVQKLVELSALLSSTEESGYNLLVQAVPPIFDILKPVFSTLTMDMLADVELVKELASNMIALVRSLWSTSSFLPPETQNLDPFQQGMMTSNYTVVRYRREAPLTLMRDPMDDFIDLFYINYPAMFEAIAVPPTTEEVMETVHMFLTNPDLSVVLKGTLGNIPWGLNASQDETIDATLGVLSSFTGPDAFKT